MVKQLNKFILGEITTLSNDLQQFTGLSTLSRKVLLSRIASLHEMEDASVSILAYITTKQELINLEMQKDVLIAELSKCRYGDKN